MVHIILIFMQLQQLYYQQHKEKIMPDSPHVLSLFDLTGKVFLVIGGARNLGKDLATALAEGGADGMLTSRTDDSASQTAAELAKATGKRIIGKGLDASSEAQIQAIIAECVKTFGRIDILVNNVGGGGGVSPKASQMLESRELEDWNTMQNLNVTAPFLLCKHIAPVMRKQKSGSIINIASIAGMIGRDRSVYVEGMAPQPIDYAAAKAAIIGMTKDIAAYLGDDNIRVNAISPGGFQRNQPKGFIERYSKKTILGRMGKDGVDLKGAALYLASDASAYVTGHNLVVDGGFTVWQ